MQYDSVQRLHFINEAIVDLFERSRAAEREAQRAANRQPVAIRDGGGLDRAAARASQNTGTTMVTGRDGKLYKQGADPTRAQPGSALYNQQQSQAAAGRPEPTPGLRGQPMTAPAPTPKAPAATPAVSSAPKAQGNIQLPAAAATALGQGDPAMKAYVGQLDQGDPWRGQTKKPEAKPAAPAPADPAASYSGMGSLDYDPAKTPPTVAAAAPAAAPAKSNQPQSSGFNTAGMGPRTIQSLTGSKTEEPKPARGFNMGSLMMTGSTPPVITSPVTSTAKSNSSLMGAANSVAGYNSGAKNAPSGSVKNSTQLDPRFSTQPMDPDTGLPISPTSIPPSTKEVGEGGPKLMPKAPVLPTSPAPQLPDSWVGNFTPPRVNTSPLAGTIQRARPAGANNFGYIDTGDPTRITYDANTLPPLGRGNVGKTPLDAFGRPTGETRVYGTRYDEKGNVNPQGRYGSAFDVSTEKAQPEGNLGADNEAGIQFGRAYSRFGRQFKDNQKYFQAEKNRKEGSKIKYDMATENVNFSAPKEYNVKNKGSLESFLSGRG